MPRAAVGAVGNRNVIYVLVEGGEGHFAARTVKLVESFDVLDGVKPGELVVIAGSFSLRAEAGRARALVDELLRRPEKGGTGFANPVVQLPCGVLPKVLLSARSLARAAPWVLGWAAHPEC